MNLYLTIFIVSAVAILAISALYIMRKIASDQKLKEAEAEALKKIDSSNQEARNIINKAYSEAQKIAHHSRKEVEDEIRARRDAVAQIEKRVEEKEKQIDNKEKHILGKEQEIEQERSHLEHLREKEEGLLKELSDKLEKIAELTKEEAESLLLKNIEKKIRFKAGKMIREVESQAKKVANRKAKELIVDAIQRTAVDHVGASTTSVVHLPDDDMKGRVIGKEGRNIRAFESATGVDVIIDDTPGAIVLSSFDPIRREIAKRAMEILLQDGRIHPTRVEEAIDKAKKALDEHIQHLGEKAADELGLEFHPEIIKLMGKLHYRTSYGQNILSHSLEAAHVAGIIAAQLGVNVELAKRGTMLHDIGKAIDFEQEGTHTDLGKEICLKYNESDEVINCIMAHHEDEEPDTIEAIIVMMADAISSARPGARRESLETYIKRLEKLEMLARNFEGVEKAYAIQAGREIRVMVKPDEVDDNAAAKLAFDMANKIESELDYPGEVKVSVVRETRAVGVAR